MKITSLLIISTLLLSIQACGKKAKKSKSGVHVSTYYVAGDPKSVVKGSTLDRTSFLTLDNFKSFNNFELFNLTTFAEKEKIVVTDNIEQGQEASTENQLKGDLRPFTFSNDGDYFFFKNTQMGIKLRFKVKDNRLDFDQLTITYDGRNQTYSVEMLHYSLVSTKDSFSFLGTVEDEESGRNLVAFYFVKPTEQTLSMGNQNYKYLGGPGVKVVWDQSKELLVNICGKQNANVVNTYTRGVNMWSAPLKDRLKLRTQQLDKYPPFSDLNVHCIYNVDSYLTTAPEEQSSNPAVAISVLDRFKSRFIDSDVIIWDREFDKGGVTYETYAGMSWVVGHEIGHVLGLDHQFDDQVKSLMGYEGIDYLTTYDWNAIQELYPKKASQGPTVY